MRRLELTGQRFGRLVVLGEAPRAAGNSSRWRCACDCGAEHITIGSTLRSGHVKSCGCQRAINMRRVSTAHGLSGHPIYSSWRAMHARCYDPTSNRYARYGARGIVVCERWHNVSLFFSDMAASYFEGASIERDDNDGDYSPSNCRWATNAEQSRNKSTTVLTADLVAKAQALYRTGAYSQRKVGEMLGGISREAVKHVLKGLRA